ncbi:MAG TPA: hypothetical protein PK636_03680 [bacterium]|nr:hypothetical protein [bacterium]HPJ71766.1 hypothetical protein [bacterium]HPQ65106.1 hypothetical protein [bacterium]
MIRFVFRTAALLVLAALVYGLVLLYREQPEEEQEAIRARVWGAFRDISLTLGKAGRRTVEQGIGLISGAEEKPGTENGE